MNWDALGAIAELGGALVVGVSVVYLAVQIRHGTRVTKAAAQDAAVTALRDVTKPLAQDAELSRIFRVGLEGISGLEGEDKFRFYHLAFQFFKGAEAVHFHHVQGILDEDIWRGYSTIFRHYFATKGFREYWDLRRDSFSPAFQRFHDSLPLSEAPKSVVELAKQTEAGKKGEGEAIERGDGE
jgi:hypothetical protein